MSAGPKSAKSSIGQEFILTEEKGSKGHALLIRCADGMTTKPRPLYGYWVHQLRWPGGILFSDLCAQEFSTPRWSKKFVSGLLRKVQHFAIEVMVKLKEPVVIALLAHEPCGAGEALGLTPEGIKSIHQKWQDDLQSRYPFIPVKLFYEPHSPCGCHRENHHELTSLKEAA